MSVKVIPYNYQLLATVESRIFTLTFPSFSHIGFLGTPFRMHRVLLKKILLHSVNFFVPESCTIRDAALGQSLSFDGFSKFYGTAHSFMNKFLLNVSRSQCPATVTWSLLNPLQMEIKMSKREKDSLL